MADGRAGQGMVMVMVMAYLAIAIAVALVDAAVRASELPPTSSPEVISLDLSSSVLNLSTPASPSRSTVHRVFPTVCKRPDEVVVVVVVAVDLASAATAIYTHLHIQTPQLADRPVCYHRHGLHLLQFHAAALPLHGHAARQLRPRRRPGDHPQHCTCLINAAHPAQVARLPSSLTNHFL